MGKQCLSQAVLELGSWGHSVLQTPALVLFENIEVFYVASQCYVNDISSK